MDIKIDALKSCRSKLDADNSELNSGWLRLIMLIAVSSVR